MEIKRLAYFAGCTARYLSPEVGKATVLVLEKNGFQTVFPSQKCCAIPKLAYGDMKGFIYNAEFNLRSLIEADCDVITACTSCALTLKREYPGVLKKSEAEAIAKRTYDVLEYLVLLNTRKMLNTDFQPVGLKVLYHAPCHLRVLGRELVDARLKLLRSIPGIKLTSLDRGCCGMGGTFGLTSKNYPLSMAIGKALFEEVKRQSPDGIITECPGCEMQIRHGTEARVAHPVTIIQQAYGL